MEPDVVRGATYAETYDAILRDDAEQLREIERKFTWDLGGIELFRVETGWEPAGVERDILPTKLPPRTHDEWIARAREHLAVARREETMNAARERHAETARRQADLYVWLANSIYSTGGPWLAWEGSSYEVGEFGPVYTSRRLKWWERALDRCGLAMWRMRYARALRRLRRRVQRTDRQVLGTARRVLDGERVEVDLDADRDRANALTRIWGA